MSCTRITNMSEMLMGKMKCLYPPFDRLIASLSSDIILVFFLTQNIKKLVFLNKIIRISSWLICHARVTQSLINKEYAFLSSDYVIKGLVHTKHAYISFGELGRLLNTLASLVLSNLPHVPKTRYMHANVYQSLKITVEGFVTWANNYCQLKRSHEVWL